MNKAEDAGYKIAPVSDFSKFKPSDKVLLLRHDVDLSLDYAYEMAAMEHSIGYHSTYYILLHSPCYNALSPKGMEIIKFISEFDHEIGLQADSRYMLPSDPYLLREIIGMDKQIKTYAQHYPSLTKQPNINNIVDSKEISMKYLSDSGRNWREGCLCKNLEKHKQIQCLCHPIWWMSNSKNRGEALKQLMRNRLDETIESVTDYSEVLANYVRDELGLEVQWRTKVQQVKEV